MFAYLLFWACSRGVWSGCSGIRADRGVSRMDGGGSWDPSLRVNGEQMCVHHISPCKPPPQIPLIYCWVPLCEATEYNIVTRGPGVTSDVARGVGHFYKELSSTHFRFIFSNSTPHHCTGVFADLSFSLPPLLPLLPYKSLFRFLCSE